MLPFFEFDIKVADYIKMNDMVLLEMIESFAFNESDKKLSDLAYAFVCQTKLHVDLQDKDATNYYSFTSDQVTKKIYSDSVLIKDKFGEISFLEEKSQLIKFVKEQLEIIEPEHTFYLEIREN